MNVFDFTIELIGKLTPIVLALIVWMQMKAKEQRAQIQVELAAVKHSVNGMKTELVEAVGQAKFAEGVKSEVDKKPDAAVEVLAVAAEAAKEVLAVAAEKAKDAP